MKQEMRGSLGRMAGVVAALTALGVLVSTVAVAEARPRPRASRFSANKVFGLGLMLGSPTGLSGKYFMGADTAFDFGVGAIYGRRRDGLHLHADFLWHPVQLAEAEPFVIPLYFGLGGRVFDFDDDEGDDDLSLGLRVPVGVALDFNNVPIDVFFELVFVLDFILEGGGRRAGLDGALGFRYYF